MIDGINVSMHVQCLKTKRRIRKPFLILMDVMLHQSARISHFYLWTKQVKGSLCSGLSVCCWCCKCLDVDQSLFERMNFNKRCSNQIRSKPKQFFFIFLLNLGIEAERRVLSFNFRWIKSWNGMKLGEAFKKENSIRTFDDLLNFGPSSIPQSIKEWNNHSVST